MEAQACSWRQQRQPRLKPRLLASSLWPFPQQQFSSEASEALARIQRALSTLRAPSQHRWDDEFPGVTNAACRRTTVLQKMDEGLSGVCPWPGRE